MDVRIINCCFTCILPFRSASQTPCRQSASCAHPHLIACPPTPIASLHTRTPIHLFLPSFSFSTVPPLHFYPSRRPLNEKPLCSHNHRRLLSPFAPPSTFFRRRKMPTSNSCNPHAVHSLLPVKITRHHNRVPLRPRSMNNISTQHLPPLS